MVAVMCVVECADVCWVHSHDEEERCIAAIDALVLPVLDERTLPTPAAQPGSTTSQRWLAANNICRPADDMILTAGRAAQWIGSVKCVKQCCGCADLVLASCQALADHLTLQCALLSNRHRLIVLSETGLTLLVHHQNEADRHGEEGGRAGVQWRPRLRM